MIDLELNGEVVKQIPENWSELKVSDFKWILRIKDILSIDNFESNEDVINMMVSVYTGLDSETIDNIPSSSMKAIAEILLQFINESIPVKPIEDVNTRGWHFITNPRQLKWREERNVASIVDKFKDDEYEMFIHWCLLQLRSDENEDFKNEFLTERRSIVENFSFVDMYSMYAFFLINTLTSETSTQSSTMDQNKKRITLG